MRKVSLIHLLVINKIDSLPHLLVDHYVLLAGCRFVDFHAALYLKHTVLHFPELSLLGLADTGIDFQDFRMGLEKFDDVVHVVFQSLPTGAHGL